MYAFLGNECLLNRAVPRLIIRRYGLCLQILSFICRKV